MRNFIGIVTNKSIWTFIMLLIACWSAFAFYKAGYQKASSQHAETIANQQEEIIKLRNMLLIERKSYLEHEPEYMATLY